MLQSMGLQRVGHDWATEQLKIFLFFPRTHRMTASWASRDADPDSLRSKQVVNKRSELVWDSTDGDFSELESNWMFKASHIQPMHVRISVLNPLFNLLQNTGRTLEHLLSSLQNSLRQKNEKNKWKIGISTLLEVTVLEKFKGKYTQ